MEGEEGWVVVEGREEGGKGGGVEVRRRRRDGAGKGCIVGGIEKWDEGRGEEGLERRVRIGVSG